VLWWSVVVECGGGVWWRSVVVECGGGVWWENIYFINKAFINISKLSREEALYLIKLISLAFFI
jgi:hypothetical protein